MTLTIASGKVRALLALPDAGPPAPLVLYLPGLGEGASGGERWRHAWAAAGMAVLMGVITKYVPEAMPFAMQMMSGSTPM